MHVSYLSLRCLYRYVLCLSMFVDETKQVCGPGLNHETQYFYSMCVGKNVYLCSCVSSALNPSWKSPSLTRLNYPLVVSPSLFSMSVELNLILKLKTLCIQTQPSKDMTTLPPGR